MNEELTVKDRIVIIERILLTWLLSDTLALNGDAEEKKEEVKSGNLLEAIEESYPNSLTVDDMARSVEKKNMIHDWYFYSQHKLLFEYHATYNE